MRDSHDSTARLAPGGLPGASRGTEGSHRRRNQVLLVLALGLGLYAAYAGRRTPVEPQQGTGISWANDSQPVAKTCFRVATYNIHRGKGTDRIRDLSRTAAVLRDTDLAGLNEIGGPAFWGQADQIEKLGRALRMGWQFAPNQYRWHQNYFGNGLLSRLEVGRWTSEPLAYDRYKSHSYRNLFTAQILAGKQPITFMVTHLDRGKIRSAQLNYVLDEFQAYTPAILVGDLNTRGVDPLLVAFFADGNNVDAIARVLGASDDKGRIDWIITRGLDVLTGGLEPLGVSDHPCYWVDVEVATEAGNGSGMGNSGYWNIGDGMEWRFVEIIPGVMIRIFTSETKIPRMPRVLDSVASSGGSRATPSRVWPSPSPYEVGTPGEVISEFDGWPVCAPVNASPTWLPASAHDSGSRWFAIPFLCGSCIRYSLPALTGAFMVSPKSAPNRSGYSAQRIQSVTPPEREVLFWQDPHATLSRQPPIGEGKDAESSRTDKPQRGITVRSNTGCHTSGVSRCIYHPSSASTDRPQSKS